MSRFRFSAVLALIFGIAATVGGQDKKDPPKDPPKEPPKVDPKPADPKPADPKPPDPNAKKLRSEAREGQKSFYQEMTTAVTQDHQGAGPGPDPEAGEHVLLQVDADEAGGRQVVRQAEGRGAEDVIDISGNPIIYDSTKQDGGVTAGNPR